MPTVFNKQLVKPAH